MSPAILSEKWLCIIYNVSLYLIQSVFLENRIYSAPVLYEALKNYTTRQEITVPTVQIGSRDAA